MEYDDETGFYHTPNRYYNPRLGVWMTPDPAGMGAADQADPQSLNRYAYVENDPINKSDPSGLCYVGDCFTGGGGGGDVYGRGFGMDFGFGCFWILCGLDWLPPDMTRGVGGTVIERGDPGTVFGIMPGENSINFPGGNPLDLLPLPLGCAAGAALGGIAGGMSSCMPAQDQCEFGSCGQVPESFQERTPGQGMKPFSHYINWEQRVFRLFDSQGKAWFEINWNGPHGSVDVHFWNWKNTPPRGKAIPLVPPVRIPGPFPVMVNPCLQVPMMAQCFLTPVPKA